jgi:hypothetical protein
MPLSQSPGRVGARRLPAFADEALLIFSRQRRYMPDWTRNTIHWGLRREGSVRRLAAAGREEFEPGLGPDGRGR